MQQRVDQYSTESNVYLEGDNRITVEIPGVTNADEILEGLAAPGSLYFIAQVGSDGAQNYSMSSETGEYELNKSIEELGELQAELARLLIKQGDVKKTTSEIADVLIMVNQLTIILDITPEELENWIKFKIDRQLERIREQEQAGADCGWRKP